MFLQFFKTKSIFNPKRRLVKALDQSFGRHRTLIPRLGRLFLAAFSKPEPKQFSFKINILFIIWKMLRRFYMKKTLKQTKNI
jgi:hypothetical protein